MKKIGLFFVTLFTLLLIGGYYVTMHEDSSILVKEDRNKDTVMHLSFGHNTPVDSALHEAAVKFADTIKEKTKGQVVIDIFPSQELGNDHQMVEMAREGKLDILLTPTAKMSVAVPSMQYADLPFYFPSREDVYAMLDGEPGQMILDDLKSIGLIGIAFWENGFKHFTANEPLLSLEDFKNKKIRVMKSRIIMEQFKSFGAEPIAIDFHSTKKALHDKVVDGQENPLVAIVSMEFYKEQSDLILSEHAFLGYVLSFSTKTFAALPQNLQMLLIDTAKEITPWEREATQKREEKLLEIIAKSGVRIHKISEQERKRFAKQTAYIPKKFEDVIGSNIISKTKELLDQKYGHIEKDHIVIGMNVDLSADSKLAGLMIKRGAEIAVAEINANGGLLGKSVELIAKDHRAISSKGIQNVLEFAKKEDLVAIVGGVHGPVISSEIETIQKLKIPYLIPWAATSGLVSNGYEDNYIFRLSANDNLVAEFLAAYTLKKYKKPALVVVNSVWGRNNLKLMKQYLQQHNAQEAVAIVFNRGQIDFEKEREQIINSNSDAIILVANPIEASNLLQALESKKVVLPIISHWGITSADFYKANKMLLKNIDLNIFQTFSFNNSLNEKGKKLLQSYQEQYTLHEGMDDIKAAHGMAQAYDLVHLLARAIKKAGTMERTQIKEALENLPSYQGVIKNYAPAFTKQNHEALDGRDYYMAKYNADGILVPVKNKEK